MPLIVVYEREVPKGVVRQDLVRLADIAPTIRNLAGLDPEMPITEGADLFANEYAVAAERAVYSETYRGREPRSVRTSKHQLIYNADDSSWEFYRLEADPQGLHNRYGDAVAEDRVVPRRPTCRTPIGLSATRRLLPQAQAWYIRAAPRSCTRP